MAISISTAMKAGIRCATKHFTRKTSWKTGEGGEKLSPQGTPVEWTAEETWFFKLSEYQDKLLNLYEEHLEFIEPESRRNEVMRFVEGGLRDLSVFTDQFRLGRARTRIAGPCHVCLG